MSTRMDRLLNWIQFKTLSADIIRVELNFYQNANDNRCYQCYIGQI